MSDPDIKKQIRAAIQKGDVQEVAKLIEADKSRLEITTQFGTWLHIAASQGKLEIVKRLVELGSDINVNGGFSDGAPISRAAAYGHLEVVRYLLDHGAKMDTSEPERNPLFSAIYGGHTHVAKLLIDAGIDTRARYTDEANRVTEALTFAQQRGQTAIADLLSKA